MKRHLLPGRRAYDDGVARPYVCTGSCYRRPGWCDCRASETELANGVAPRPLVLVRPAITVHRVPFGRRVRRFLRAVWRHLCAARFL